MTISFLKAGLWAPAIILCSALSASGLAAEYSVEANYLLKAERYTVKIRTRVEYPTLKDKKGSFTGAGFLINKEKGWIATNAHVSSRNPESIEIAFKDRRFVEAKLQFIDRYLEQLGEAAFCSPASYQIESIGVQLFAKMSGCHYGILGIPLLELMAILREHGLSPVDKKSQNKSEYKVGYGL